MCSKLGLFGVYLSCVTTLYAKSTFLAWEHGLVVPSASSSWGGQLQGLEMGPAVHNSFAHGPMMGQLDNTEGAGAWCAAANNPGEWFQMNFLSGPFELHGIVIQGRSSKAHFPFPQLQWVHEFEILYSDGEGNWLNAHPLDKPTGTRFTVSDPQKNQVLISTPTLAYSVRIKVISCQVHCSLRADALVARPDLSDTGLTDEALSRRIIELNAKTQELLVDKSLSDSNRQDFFWIISLLAIAVLIILGSHVVMNRGRVDMWIAVALICPLTLVFLGKVYADDPVRFASIVDAIKLYFSPK